mgnify:CR=1 FL=1
MAVRSLRIVVLVIVAFAAGLLLARLIAPSKVEPPQTERATVFPAARAVPALDLVDQDGKPLGPDFFKGHWTLVFFGFTQCPDVCPTTLTTLAEAMKQLGPDADRVQGVFVTVDPERDTAELLKQYVPAFDPRFVGLRGDAAQTEAVAKEFRIIFQKVPGRTPETYTVDHSAGIFLFDPAGRLRVYEGHGQPPDVLAHDLRLLLES